VTRWVSSPLLRKPTLSTSSVLIFADNSGFSDRLLQAQSSMKCIIVRHGDFYSQSSNGFVIGQDPTDLNAVFDALERPPSLIIHCWSLDIPPVAHLRSLTSAQAFGTKSVLALVQKLQSLDAEQYPSLLVITRNAQALDGPPQPINIQQSPLLGFLRTLQLEIPRLRCFSVDLDLKDSDEHLAAVWTEADLILHQNAK
jgi:hypothetical protein